MLGVEHLELVRAMQNSDTHSGELFPLLDFVGPDGVARAQWSDDQGTLREATLLQQLEGGQRDTGLTETGGEEESSIRARDEELYRLFLVFVGGEGFGRKRFGTGSCFFSLFAHNASTNAIASSAESVTSERFPRFNAMTSSW